MAKSTGKVREKSGNFVSPEKWEPWRNLGQEPLNCPPPFHRPPAIASDISNRSCGRSTSPSVFDYSFMFDQSEAVTVDTRRLHWDKYTVPQYCGAVLGQCSPPLSVIDCLSNGYYWRYWSTNRKCGSYFIWPYQDNNKIWSRPAALRQFYLLSNSFRF